MSCAVENTMSVMTDARRCELMHTTDNSHLVYKTFFYVSATVGPVKYLHYFNPIFGTVNSG